MKAIKIIAIVGVVALGVRLGIAVAAENGDSAKPKHTIKEVMQLAHKDGLMKKVASGDASAAEKRELLNLYISLAENKPPVGDAASWHKLTDATLMASAKVVAGRKDGLAALKKATACAACHKLHKPPASS